ncbi:hypothetical protein LQ757_05940 [Agromyces sp. SYSU K20354]|uniref:hypothetical protein n=1 Tax=Agromyces cavernae TaxID=2898659 RepID=UPI001E6090C8|nr:hypothetical protein [Agromyces cavernae]MCD2441817.1 hypothetical protein [Agromyces cavernae]
MSETRVAPVIRSPFPWLMLTFGLGAIVLVLPIAIMLEGVMVANNYASLPGGTAAGHAAEAMFSVGLGGFLSAIIVVACAGVAGIIAHHGRLSVLVTIVLGTVLILLVTLPFAWLFIQPVGGAWLA